MEKYTFGDVNCDGKITATDNAYLYEKAANLNFRLPVEEFFDITYFDIDCDGKITSNDAELLLKKVSQMDYPLPIEKKGIISVDDLEVGTYTSDIVSGNATNGFITISASKDNPVTVKEVDVYKKGEFELEPVSTIGYKITSGNTEKIKLILLNENNTISVNTNNYGGSLNFTICHEQYFTDNNLSNGYIGNLTNKSTGSTADPLIGLPGPVADEAYCLRSTEYPYLEPNSEYTFTNSSGQYALLNISYYVYDLYKK